MQAASRCAQSGAGAGSLPCKLIRKRAATDTWLLFRASIVRWICDVLNMVVVLLSLSRFISSCADVVETKPVQETRLALPRRSSTPQNPTSGDDLVGHGGHSQREVRTACMKGLPCSLHKGTTVAASYSATCAPVSAGRANQHAGTLSHSLAPATALSLLCDGQSLKSYLSLVSGHEILRGMIHVLCDMHVESRPASHD